MKIKKPENIEELFLLTYEMAEKIEKIVDDLEKRKDDIEKLKNTFEIRLKNIEMTSIMQSMAIQNNRIK